MSNVIKLTKVNDFTLKSFANYTGPSDEFLRSNIFYAPNGNGKTSLSEGIKNEYLKTHGESGLRIYDKNFVNDHLLLEEDGNIKGVKAEFGKKDVDLEKQIKQLEAANQSTETSIRELEKENQLLITNTESAIEDIFKRRKGKANIAKKSHKDGVHEKVIQLWIDEYTVAAKKFPDENFEEIDGDKDFTATLTLINGLNIPQVAQIEDDAGEELTRILAKTYKSQNIPAAEVLEWLDRGVHLHADKSNCEFCGSSIDIDQLREKIKAFTLDEKNLDRKKIESVRAELQTTYGTIKQFLDNQETTITVLIYEESVKSLIESLGTVLEPLANYGKQVSQKIEKMDNAMTIDAESLINLLQTANSDLLKIEEARERQSKLFTDKINRLEILVKGAIGHEVKESILIATNATKYTDNVKELTRLSKQSRQELQNVKKLRESKSDLAEFSNYLNAIFSDMGINFRLALAGNSYILQHAISGIDLQVQDISEGERNLLALVYFYFEMLSKDLKNLRTSIELIIVDDPATSMDDENRFYILELVKSIISNKSLQSFVLTHSWRDYCDLCYARNEQGGVRQYDILKVEGVSSISLSRSVVTPYKKLYKEVNDFSVKPVAEVTSDEAVHMPNTMRRVLEEYLRFNFGIPLATQSSYNKIAEVMFETNITNIGANDEAKLRKLLSVCNILSHGAPQTRSVAETHSSSRFLIERMSAINKYHHDHMKEA